MSHAHAVQFRIEAFHVAVLYIVVVDPFHVGTFTLITVFSHRKQRYSPVNEAIFVGEVRQNL